MWHFARTVGWIEIEDFLRKPRFVDFADELDTAGYQRTKTILLGGQNSGFDARVFTAKPDAHPPYPFLVAVSVGSTLECVCVSEFPDLIELLSKLGSAAEAAAVADEREERTDAEFQRMFPRTST